MAQQHTTLHAKAASERRPAVATTQRKAVAVALSPARALQQRLGNRATQDLIARSIASPAKERTTVAPVVRSAIPPTIQLSSTTLPAKVSRPGDRAEVEAEDTARKVMRMHEPPASKRGDREPMASNGTAQSTVQRTVAAPHNAAPVAPSRVNISGGSPLPSAVRSFMEPRFGANFGNVRVHTNEAAAQQSASLNANAFAIGEHVFFGQGRFQPQSDGGRELIAHELTHTIQQGAAVQRDVVHRSADVHVSEHVNPQVQGDWFDIPNPRDYFAKKAALIPGFTMLTVVIGFNPINNVRVERNAGNIQRAAIEMMPGGALITQALQNHGVFDRVSLWASTQFEALKDIGSSIWGEIENFIKDVSAKDLLDLGGLWDRAKNFVLQPINRIIAFAKGLFDRIVALIKEAILKPIAEFAKTSRGYPLLCTVMGKDPITGEPVAQNPETLLGAFLKFIGEEETWNTMQKANAIPRAFAWFNGALNTVRGFVSAIPGLFLQAFRALEIADIILIPRAFAKLVGVFGGFAVRFVTWGASAVWTLLEIVFDVVSPGALAYIKKTGAALRNILRNPLPFVGNLVRAAKLGSQNFGDNFVGHLKAGLIDWLTGSLQGVYIPKALNLSELGKFAISVLGISWTQIRGKIVKVLGPTGETIMKGMETGFDIVVKLVTGGPAAAWELIKEKLTDLKDQVVSGIVGFVSDTVVKKAIPKLISMFIPGAGFVSAILSIYDTIMVFVEKIKQIAQVVTGFIDSIVAIAAGQIGAAATRVENALAGVLSLAINFLAGFVGLGNVTDKIKAVIEKVRVSVDKAIDAVVAWIVDKAKKLFAIGKAAVGKVLRWAFATTTFKDGEGKQHTVSVSETGVVTVASTPQAAKTFVDWYVKEKNGDAKLANQIKSLITNAEKIVSDIEKMTPKGGTDVPAPAKQQELLARFKMLANIKQYVFRNAVGR